MNMTFRRGRRGRGELDYALSKRTDVYTSATYLRASGGAAPVFLGSGAAPVFANGA